MLEDCDFDKKQCYSFENPTCARLFLDSIFLTPRISRMPGVMLLIFESSMMVGSSAVSARSSHVCARATLEMERKFPEEVYVE